MRFFRPRFNQMLSLFRHKSARSSVKPSLDSLRFDTTGYTLGSDPTEVNTRTWFTDEGDGLGIFLFTLPPDLPTVCTVNDLRNFYEIHIRSNGGQMVEISTMEAAGCSVLRLISKIKQQQSGMTYVGSVTFPFREFSFVVKVQCAELETTGIREAVLLSRLLAKHPINDEHSLLRIVEAAQFDSEQFDDEFPWHPLSRARRVLKRICGSVSVEREIAACPRFPLPL